ncbi:MAG: hypothetical protein E7642_08510 [Ruminococcaceae bacterium]|nr:hypothetical protein [Oscillospiraceae bacterium]
MKSNFQKSITKICTFLCTVSVLFSVSVIHSAASTTWYDGHYGNPNYDSRNFEGYEDDLEKIESVINHNYEKDNLPQPQLEPVAKVYYGDFQDLLLNRKDITAIISALDRIEYVYKITDQDETFCHSWFVDRIDQEIDFSATSPYHHFDYGSLYQNVSNPKELFLSADITKKIAQTEIKNIYCFNDYAYQKYIWYDTADGQYICFMSRSTASNLEFIFPVDVLKKILTERNNILGNLSNYNIDHNTITTMNEGVIRLDLILTVLRDNNPAKYVVGGQAAIDELYPNFTPDEFLPVKSTEKVTEQPPETIPSATETEPIIIDIVKPFNVFKLLFFVETAIVVVGAVIFTVIRFKKKRIKQ